MERVRECCPKGSVRSLFPYITLLFLLFTSSPVWAQGGGGSDTSGLDGKALFESNCATCHHPVDEVQGPPLKGAEARWEEEGQRDLLYEWVRNPNEVADMGNDYVDDLVAEWEPKYGMMNARNVSDEEIDAILAYVENWEPPKDEAVAQDGGAGGKGKTGKEEGELWFWLIVISAVLLIVVLTLNGVRKSLLRTVEAKEPAPQTPVHRRVGNWMARHKVITSLIIIFLILGGLRDGWNTLMGIGVYQGYQPEQPIEFSHKLHAGDNDINCQYCHSSVEDSKYPTIPSGNVCMNCHQSISEGPKHGKEEIAKLYDAVGWDPKQVRYTDDTEPIKWVKVHELPDLAYFNHSQHTNVAELECKECHGEVREMEVIEQEEELTMGWCLDCHQEKEVDMDGNAYYQEMKERMPDSLHKEYLHDEKVSVRELGGWECAKCHY